MNIKREDYLEYVPRLLIFICNKKEMLVKKGEDKFFIVLLFRLIQHE